MNNENYKGHIFTVRHHKYFAKNYAPKSPKETSYLKQSKWARCEGKNNIMNYLSSHIDKEQANSPYDSKKEIANFSGFFDRNKLLAKQDKEILKANLQNTDATIYTAVFSFSNQTNIKCSDSSMAREIIQKTFDNFLEKANLDPNNVEWFGCVHTNTDHIHSHIVFFEKEKRFFDSDGNLTYRTTTRNKLPKNALNDYREDVALYMVKNSSIYEKRDDALQSFKNKVKELTSKDIIHKYSLQMDDFSVKQYNRLTNDNKKIVDSCIDELLNTEPSLKEKKEEYEHQLELLQEDLEIGVGGYQYANSRKRIKSYSEEKLEIFHNRLGNQVLKIMIMDKETRKNKSDYKKEKSSKKYYANSASIIRKKAIISRNADYEFNKNLNELIKIMSNTYSEEFVYKDLADMVQPDSTPSSNKKHSYDEMG